jgi:hypothetical protein
VWTGRGGVSSVTAVLTDASLQDTIQSDLYLTGLQNLRNAGIATGTEQPAKLAGLVQAASKYSTEVIKPWINGTLANQPLVDTLNKTVRSAQYSVELSTEKINNALKGFSTVPVSSTNTVNRTAVDNAMTSVIGNPKVPTPNYRSTADDVRLTYTGDDSIVWDRVNEERLRLGLPGLADIGLPRPA